MKVFGRSRSSDKEHSIRFWDWSRSGSRFGSGSRISFSKMLWVNVRQIFGRDKEHLIRLGKFYKQQYFRYWDSSGSIDRGLNLLVVQCIIIIPYLFTFFFFWVWQRCITLNLSRWSARHVHTQTYTCHNSHLRHCIILANKCTSQKMVKTSFAFTHSVQVNNVTSSNQDFFCSLWCCFMTECGKMTIKQKINKPTFLCAMCTSHVNTTFWISHWLNSHNCHNNTLNLGRWSARYVQK